MDFLVGERENLDFLVGSLGTPDQIDQYQKELEQVLADFGQDVRW